MTSTYRVRLRIRPAGIAWNLFSQSAAFGDIRLGKGLHRQLICRAGTDDQRCAEVEADSAQVLSARCRRTRASLRSASTSSEYWPDWRASPAQLPRSRGDGRDRYGLTDQGVRQPAAGAAGKRWRPQPLRRDTAGCITSSRWLEAAKRGWSNAPRASDSGVRMCPAGARAPGL